VYLLKVRQLLALVLARAVFSHCLQREVTRLQTNAYNSTAFGVDNETGDNIDSLEALYFYRSISLELS